MMKVTHAFSKSAEVMHLIGRLGLSCVRVLGFAHEVQTTTMGCFPVFRSLIKLPELNATMRKLAMEMEKVRP